MEDEPFKPGQPKKSDRSCPWYFALLGLLIFIIFILAVTVDFSPSKPEPPKYLLSISNGTLQGVTLLGNWVDLDLSDQNIRIIEDGAFDNLSAVKSLNLSRNELEHLPPTIFSRMTELRTLSLAENKIADFPTDVFSALNNLGTLNISHNSLKHLRPKIFHGLTSYTDIFIEGNNLYSMSSEIFHEAMKLHDDHSGYEVRLDDNKRDTGESEKAPEGSSIIRLRICKTNNGTVTSLQSLDNNNSTINNTEIDRAINCTDIPSSSTTIHLENLSIQNFQKGWYNVSDVTFTKLILTHNNITRITPEILNDLPPNVIDVDLSFNDIDMIRRNDIKARLRSLRISSNKIWIIERNALRKTLQTELDVSMNRLTSLNFDHQFRLFDGSDEVSKGLGSTVFINFDNNKIGKVLEDTFEELKVTNNYAKAAFSLSLANNEIEVIEKSSFADMPLVKLNLQNNRISTIPGFTFFISKSLAHLNLSNNFLMNIDESMLMGIRNLKSLDISGNRIADPNWYMWWSSNFRQLDRLDLSRNPLERLENGAMYGLVGPYGLAVNITMNNTPLKVIRGGVFDERRSSWF